jgi:hypothetical protein
VINCVVRRLEGNNALITAGGCRTNGLTRCLSKGGYLIAGDSPFARGSNRGRRTDQRRAPCGRLRTATHTTAVHRLYRPVDRRDTDCRRRRR